MRLNVWKILVIGLVILALVVMTMRLSGVIRVKEVGGITFTSFGGERAKIDGYNLMGNGRYFLFRTHDEFVREPTRFHILDIENDTWLQIAGERNAASGAYLSKLDKDVLYLATGSTAPEQYNGTNIHKCDLKTRKCEHLFWMDGSAREITDLPNGDLLFVSSPPRENHNNGYLNFYKNDFWIRRPDGGLRKISDLKLGDIYHVTLTRGGLFFDSSSVGGQSSNQDIFRASHIFRVSDPQVLGESSIITKAGSPAVVFGGWIDGAPSGLPELPYIAFYSRQLKQDEEGKRGGSIILWDMVRDQFDDVLSFKDIDHVSKPVLIDENNLVYMVQKPEELALYRRDFKQKKTFLIKRFTKAEAMVAAPENILSIKGD